MLENTINPQEVIRNAMQEQLAKQNQRHRHRSWVDYYTDIRSTFHPAFPSLRQNPGLIPAELIKEQFKWLDAGCGMQHAQTQFAYQAQELYPDSRLELIGIDALSPNHLSSISAKNALGRIKHMKSFLQSPPEFIQADLNHIDFYPNLGCDLLTFSASLIYTENPVSVLLKFAKHVKEGGTLFASLVSFIKVNNKFLTSYLEENISSNYFFDRLEHENFSVIIKDNRDEFTQALSALTLVRGPMKTRKGEMIFREDLFNYEIK